MNSQMHLYLYTGVEWWHASGVRSPSPRLTCMSRRPPWNNDGREMVASGLWGELAALGKAKSDPTHPPRHQSTNPFTAALLVMAPVVWEGKQSSTPNILNRVIHLDWVRPLALLVQSMWETEDQVETGATSARQHKKIYAPLTYSGLQSEVHHFLTDN